MLRSIIAVWSVAIALIIVAAMAGCGGSVAECATSCPPCATDRGEFCFQGSATSQLPSFCARGCADDRDCADGEICAALFASLQPPVCIRAGSPRGCGAASPNWHCDFPPPSCKDAATLVRPFSHADDQVCGGELVHCDDGCETDHCM